LEGRFPESRMKGEPSDISPLAAYVFYEWVKSQDTLVNFPDSKIQLEIYMGAAIDNVSMMARKVLKANGQMMYHTSIRYITPDEIHYPTEI
jgi:hypothetical protein